MSVASVSPDGPDASEIELRRLRNGLVLLVVVNSIVALISVVTSELISRRLWSNLSEPRIGIDRLLVYSCEFFANIPRAQILTAMICAAILPPSRIPGVVVAIVPALVLGFIHRVIYFIVNVQTPIPPSFFSRFTLAPPVTLYLLSLFVFVGTKCLQALTGWRIHSTRYRSHALNRAQFGVRAIFEWMTVVGVLAVLGKAGGWSHPRLFASWLIWGSWQMLASAPLALAVLSDGKWRRAWISAALTLIPVALIGSELYASGWTEIRVLTFVWTPAVIAYILVIGTNFLTLRRMGYRLVVPARQTHVAVT
jgi:hypothetical protein